MKFIDIVSTKKSGGLFRGSCFLVERDGSLRVVGNLPHGYTFKMKDERAAARLADWLKGGRNDDNL